MKIRHVRPYSTSGNIGLEYNQVISELPDDCYVCLTDGDVMFLHPDWGNHIEAIITDNTDYELITCMTNRIGVNMCCVDSMFNNHFIPDHVHMAKNIWLNYETKVLPTDLAPGMLMIFHKSTWQKYKFVEKSIIFDKQFSDAIIKGGGKIGVARGLYIFHIYRLWSETPKTSTKHLLKLWHTK